MHKIIAAAAVVGKVKPIDLVVKVRLGIVKSEYPAGLTHMRSVAAIRQQFSTTGIKVLLISINFWSHKWPHCICFSVLTRNLFICYFDPELV